LTAERPVRPAAAVRRPRAPGRFLPAGLVGLTTDWVVLPTGIEADAGPLGIAEEALGKHHEIVTVILDRYSAMLAVTSRRDGARETKACAR
jgi:hypothetical protein